MYSLPNVNMFDETQNNIPDFETLSVTIGMSSNINDFKDTKGRHPWVLLWSIEHIWLKAV